MANALLWQPFWLTPVKFILQPTTLMFATAALASGALLIWSSLSGRSGSRGLSTLQTTQLINSKNAIVVDLRDPAEFAAGTVTGARNMPAETVPERLVDLARFKSRPLILICSAGQRSGRAVAEFTAGGFTEVYNLTGGVNAWREAGLPLVKGGQKDSVTPSGKKEKV